MECSVRTGRKRHTGKEENGIPARRKNGIPARKKTAYRQGRAG
jgi:hypothetical protein